MTNMPRLFSKYAKYSLLWPGLLWLIFIAAEILLYILHDSYGINIVPLNLWLLLLPVVAVFVGILFGILALKEIKESENLKGKAMSILGIFIWFFLLIVLFII